MTLYFALVPIWNPQWVSCCFNTVFNQINFSLGHFFVLSSLLDVSPANVIMLISKQIVDGNKKIFLLFSWWCHINYRLPGLLNSINIDVNGNDFFLCVISFIQHNNTHHPLYQRWTIGSNLEPAPIWPPEPWGSSSSSEQKKWSLKLQLQLCKNKMELKSSSSSSGEKSWAKKLQVLFRFSI